MKKIYLKDMEKEELKDLIINNNDFLSKYGELLYEDYMFMQEEEGKLMFGKDQWEYIDIRDNYSSFYLRLINWHKFIDNLDKDYLCDKGLDLYNEIIELKKEYENTDMVENEDRFDELEEILEEKSKELLGICEDQLHEYENFPSNEDIFDFILDNDFEEGYYTDEEKKKIYEDIAYTKEYN